MSSTNPSRRASDATAVSDSADFGTSKTSPADKVGSDDHHDQEKRAAAMTASPQQEKAAPTPAAAAAEESGSFEVGFDGPGDKQHPHNWGIAKRWYLTMLGGSMVLNSTFASVLPSSLIADMGPDLGNFSRELGICIISFFVLGYCFGPLLWGPLSERYGRRIALLGAFAPYVLFQIGCALSQNIWSMLIFRFLSGTFASAPLAVSGALIADVWDPKRRGIGMGVFSLMPFAGPAIAPVIGGFMHVKQTDWRISFWILFAFAGFIWLLCLFTLKETYAPFILTQKARKLRKETGDDRYYSPLEREDKGTVAHQVHDIVAKPFIMIAQEPMLVAVTLYMSFIYGTLYLLFQAFPIVFESPKPQGHGLNAGISGLMFVPFFLGGVAGVLFYILVINPRYAKKVAQYAPNPVPPEARLEMCLYGAPMMALSFFWFGWTSYSWISFWSPAIAGAFIGMSFLLVFLGFFNYLIDTYLRAAATALAVNTVARSLFGAAFPLFATQMFENLGTRFALLLISCLATLFVPLPFVLKKYGPKIRAMSKHSPVKH